MFIAGSYSYVSYVEKSIKIIKKNYKNNNNKMLSSAPLYAGRTSHGPKILHAGFNPSECPLY